MCGRYVIEDFQELSEILRGIPFQSFPDFTPTWNAAPGQHLPVLIEADGSYQLQPMLWGLVPGWIKPGDKPKITPINARAETISEKPMFRGLVKHNRCLVPANGFYEWKSSSTTKQPWFIHLRNSPLMLMAGLYSVRATPDGDSGSYTIITGPPNSVMAEIHNRMPMMIHPEDIPEWLDPDITELAPLAHLLQPVADEEIQAFEVSRAVNNVRNNGPELVDPIASQEELL